MTFLFLAFVGFLYDFVLCPSFTVLVPFFHRFEDKRSTKVVAGPGVEIRGRSFFVALLKLRGPLKCDLFLPPVRTLECVQDCTVPYPGIDKVKVKVNVEVKVNIRRCLSKATPSASIAKAGRHQEEASP